MNPVLTICPLAKVPALFYDQRRVGLGEELLDEVEALLQFIRAHTELGRQGLHGTRSFPTKRAHGELAAERLVARRKTSLCVNTIIHGLTPFVMSAEMRLKSATLSRSTLGPGRPESGR